jgi:hypothetical protein
MMYGNANASAFTRVPALERHHAGALAARR